MTEEFDEFEERIGGPRTYFKYDDCEEDQVLVVGTFLDRVPNKFGKVNFEFRPDDGGSVVALNYTGQLDYILKDVAIGERVKIIYKGKIILEKGSFKGKDANQFEVRRARRKTDLKTEVLPAKNDSDEIEIDDLS